MYGLQSVEDISDITFRALDHAGDVVMVMERDGTTEVMPRIVHVNDAACRLSGRSRQEMVGLPFGRLLSPAIEPLLLGELHEALRRTASLRTALPCITAAGDLFWLGLHLMPSFAHDQTCSHFVLLGRDISAQRAQRERDEAAQALVAKVFVSVDAAVGIVGMDGRFIMANPHLERLLGQPPGTLEGRATLEFVAPQSIDKARQARDLQERDQQPYSIALHALRPNGTQFDIRLTSVLLNRTPQQRYRIITVTPTDTNALHEIIDVPQARFQVAGKIRFISLDDLKAVLGPRWDGVRDRVMQTAEHIIRKRCGPADTHARTDDNGYTICFAEANEEEASFRAAAIGREIRFRVIGDGENPDAVHVGAVVTRVKLPPEVPGQHPALTERRRLEAVSTQLAAAETDGRAAIGRAVASEGWALEAVRAREDETILGWYVHLPNHGRGGMALATAPPQAAGAMLDFAAHQEGEELLFVDVAFDLFLARRMAEAYLEQCQALTPKVQRRLVLMLAGMPEGVPRSRVLEVTQRLRPHCRSVGFVVDDLDLPPVDMDLIKAPLLAVNAIRWGGGAHLPEARLTRLLAALHAYRGRLLMRHVSSPVMARHVRSLGVDWVSIQDAT